ncbi:MAG TPA: hypothetical protein VLL52_03060 [Anaerolineae bacterium]|nr:hypothetical protein [Anaerolineae bacterium]
MPFVWVIIIIPFLLMTQRWLHKHIQGVALLITKRHDWAFILYALVFFPGVVIHELSHWLMANLLGVRTGQISVIPQIKENGGVQFGYVEYYRTKGLDPVRESLIGGAPLISGTIITLLIAFQVFNVDDLGLAIRQNDLAATSSLINQTFQTNDFLVWLYLLFAVSNAMMPSPSDRRAWPAFGITLAVLAVILYLFDLQAWLWQGVGGPVALVFGYLGLALSLTVGTNIAAICVIATLEYIIGRIRGLELNYGD